MMKRGLHTLPRNLAAINAFASQWISLQDDIQTDYIGAESDVQGVLGQTGSNPRRQTSTTQGYESCSRGMTNDLIPGVNVLRNSSTLAVSASINVSIKLCFVSVNGPRETYFVGALRRFCLDFDSFKPDEIGKW